MDIPVPEENFSSVQSIILQHVAADSLMAAVDAGIFDALDKKPLSLTDLATHFWFIEKRLGAILDLLISLSLIESDGKVYRNTLLASEYLVSTSPLYQGDTMRMTIDFSKNIAGNITDLLCNEKSERENTDEKWAADEAMEGTAQEALGGGLHKAVEFLKELQGFSDFTKMADLGANHGTYSMALLDANPGLESSLVDFPKVLEASRKRCEKYGYMDRINYVGLDLREDKLPRADFDLIFASHILYSCQENLHPLLRKIYNSLRPGGWFAAHHYARTGSKMPVVSASSLNIITIFAGYFSHFIEPDFLEGELGKAGFSEFKRKWTDKGKGIMLITARR